MVDRGTRKSYRMQGLPHEGKYPLQNLSNEGNFEVMTSKTGSVAPQSDQHIE